MALVKRRVLKDDFVRERGSDYLVQVWLTDWRKRKVLVLMPEMEPGLNL